MKYEIVPITKLKPLEQVFPEHLRNLETMIDKDGFILKAIIIDKKTGIVLDGSHRYVYLLKNGYKEAPVFMVDYLSEDIRVGTRLEHRFFIEGTSGISKKECIDRGVSGNIYPPRTTRHFFPFRKSDISLPLTSLKKLRKLIEFHTKNWYDLLIYRPTRDRKNRDVEQISRASKKRR